MKRCALNSISIRLVVASVCFSAFNTGYGVAQAACILGQQKACPVLLRMSPGAWTIDATGSVSAEQPDYYFKFYAKAGQMIVIKTIGGGLKTGPGISMSGPNGDFAVNEDTQHMLPATGAYLIDLRANLMSEGPFGQFKMTLRIPDLPTLVGECVNTRVKLVATRLGTPGSGSTVLFQNGGSQVSYDTVPAIDQSRKGDPVRMCLVYIPRNCPEGDYRGRKYRTTNLRSHQTWTEYDSEHLCGGA
jgi:hypothetical protein